MTCSPTPDDVRLALLMLSSLEAAAWVGVGLLAVVGFGIWTLVAANATQKR